MGTIKVHNYIIDINKCRKNILYDSKYDYPVFTCMDKPQVYDCTKHNGAGIYFIETRRYFPTRKNGWYYKPMVDYLLDMDYITHEDIKSTVQSSLTIKHDYYNKFIDHIYSTLPISEAKLAINSMIGNFKPNIHRHTQTQSVCILSLIHI